MSHIVQPLGSENQTAEALHTQYPAKQNDPEPVYDTHIGKKHLFLELCKVNRTVENNCRLELERRERRRRAQEAAKGAESGQKRHLKLQERLDGGIK